MSHDVALHVGDRVILLPAGLLGRVRELHDEGGEPHFIFDNLETRVAIPLHNTTRWRHPMSADEAQAIEQRILTAKAIENVVPKTGTVLSSDPDPARKVLAKHLAGTLDHRVAAYATLLDWAAAANAEGQDAGLWRGLLHQSRDYLLGELALIRGKSHDDYQRALIDARHQAASRPRVALTDAPDDPQAPTVSLTVDIFDYGAHSLGVINVEAELHAITDCWDHENPRLDVGEIEGSLGGAVRPGVWSAWLHIQDPSPPAALAAELNRVADNTDLTIAFELGFRRSWLVIAHESRVAALPVPHASADPSLNGLTRLHAMADSGRDLTEEIPYVVPSTGNTLDTLECIGNFNADGGQWALIAGRVLTPAASTALRLTSEPLASSWPWGLLLRCGCTANHPLFAAGPKNMRTLIALPTAWQ